LLVLGAAILSPKVLLQAASLVLFFCIIGGCHPAAPTGANSTLRRALGGEPASLDPGSAADSFSSSLLIDLYEGLTSESPSGDVVPGVAESWSVDTSGTEYTFQIRAAARWSNGSKVRAGDFVASWRREIDPKFGSPTADDLRLIKHATDIIAGKTPATELGASAPSDSILVVKLERAVPYFPQIVAHPSTFPIYSAASAVTHRPAEWVSNGAYTLAGWQPTTRIELNANPMYWDREHVKIAHIQYQFTPSDAAQYAGYRADELDMTDLVPANALPALRRDHPSELVVTPFLATAYYGFNLANKTLANGSLRQALSMAIDRRRLVESLGFDQVPAFGFVPPGTANYAQQSWSWKTLPDDERIHAAQALYLQAGFSKSKPLRLRVLFNHNEVIERTAVLIAAMWREVLGVETELTAEEFKVFLQSRHDTSRWDLARLAWTADYNDASNFLDVLRTHSPNNDMGYSNQLFDNALDAAAATMNTAQRSDALQSAETRMLDDYPIIPLYYFVSKRLVKPYVHGVIPNPFNHVPSKNLSLVQGEG
jgi:oligopeptide transport system substrate-binding protein